MSTRTLSSLLLPYSSLTTGAKYSFAISNSTSGPGKPAAANPCLQPLSYANDTDGDVNRSLIGTYSREFVAFATIERKGGGTKARREDRIGDVDDDDLSSLVSSSSTSFVEAYGSSRLM